MTEETVNHPLHYGGDTTYEHIKVVRAWGLGYMLGNSTKYICRAGKKNSSTRLEDLEKAAWYLNNEIEEERRLIAQKLALGLTIPPVPEAPAHATGMPRRDVIHATDPLCSKANFSTDEEIAAYRVSPSSLRVLPLIPEAPLVSRPIHTKLRVDSSDSFTQNTLQG